MAHKFYFIPASYKRLTASGLLLAGTLFGAAQPSFAADTSAPALEEIVVTARYRPTALAETPASIAVLPEAVLAQRGALHLQDVLNAAPNISWSAGSSRARYLQVRGIGDLEQFYDPKYYPSVGLLVDQMELGDSANAAMLYDVEQVEILRGPQGTRFGASAHAGMVQVRTRAPTDDYEGSATVGIANRDSYNLGAVVSGPLDENWAGRLAIAQNHSDGFTKNRELGRDNTGELDELTARARLQWQPSDTATYELSALYFDADNGYDAWSVDNTRSTFTDQPGRDTQETLGLTLSGDWLLDHDRRVQAVVSFIDTNLHQHYDADWVADAVCARFACSDGNDTAQELFDRARERWVMDIRLLGGIDDLNAGEGRYALGLYANRSEAALDYGYPSVWFGDFSSASNYETERVALYGEYEYAVSEMLSLTAGLRLERFEDDYRNSPDFSSDTNDKLWSIELGARYTPTDNTALYATLARSTKPGGVNTTASANQPFMSPTFQTFTMDKLRFNAEDLLNFELGLRYSGVDERLRLSLALFHTLRSDAQLESWMWDANAGLWIGYLDSTSDATSSGVELTASFAVDEALALYANLGWLRTEVEAIETFDLDRNTFVTKSDRQQAKAPEYQYNIGLRRRLQSNLYAHIEVEGQDDSYFGYYHDGKLDDYALINAGVQWAWRDLSINFWGRNLADKDYAVHGLYFAVDPRDDFGAWSNQTYTQFGEPRSYGVNVRYDF